MYAIRSYYELSSREIIDFLLSRGIRHIIALHYAHKPGVARQLNAYMAKICNSNLRVTAMATVFPGEKDARGILQDAFQSGLGGVKLHCHVQCFDMNSDAMNEIYEQCSAHNRPLIMHVGRAPKSPAYPCDPVITSYSIHYTKLYDSSRCCCSALCPRQRESPRRSTLLSYNFV